MLAGTGRLDSGTNQALSSRYATIANLFWICLLALLMLWMYEEPLRRRIGGVALAGAFFFVLIGYRHGGISWAERQIWLHEARDALIAGEHDDRLKRLYPSPEILVERAQILQKYGLAVFKNEP